MVKERKEKAIKNGSEGGLLLIGSRFFPYCLPWLMLFVFLNVFSICGWFCLKQNTHKNKQQKHTNLKELPVRCD